MHALSLPTWWIHITSVAEWMVAIAAVVALVLTAAGWDLLQRRIPNRLVGCIPPLGITPRQDETQQDGHP